jgi:hypothetical protein
MACIVQSIAERDKLYSRARLKRLARGAPLLVKQLALLITANNFFDQLNMIEGGFRLTFA